MILYEPEIKAASDKHPSLGWMSESSKERPIVGLVAWSRCSSTGRICGMSRWLLIVVVVVVAVAPIVVNVEHIDDVVLRLLAFPLVAALVIRKIVGEVDGFAFRDGLYPFERETVDVPCGFVPTGRILAVLPEPKPTFVDVRAHPTPAPMDGVGPL